MTTNLAISLGLGVTAVLFISIWIGVYLLRRKWPYVSFTPHKFVEELKTGELVLTDDTHAFEPRLGHYLKTAEVVVTLAAASLVFIPRVRVTSHPEWFAFSMTLLGTCVLCLILFMVLLLFFYEDSLYFPKNYTVTKSAFVFSLGATGLCCFVLAYLSIAGQVAKAVGEKAILVN